MSTPAEAPTLLHHGAPDEPPSGLTHPLALRPVPLFRGVFGVLLAFVGFALVVPLTSELVLRAGYALRGGGDYATYRLLARTYAVPEGLLAGLLGLAVLTPVVWFLVRHVHGRAMRWTWSVQPGLRWRYLLAVLLVAFVVLNGMLWLGFVFDGGPRVNAGQPDAEWFLLVVVFVSPLQALAEEVFFRGYLQQAIGSMAGRAWLGILGSSLVFALLHGLQNPALFTHRFAFGIVAGTLVLVTGGLEAGIAAHVVNNLGAFGYAIFTTSVAEVRAVQEITWAKASWDILSFATFAVIAWWVGRRMQLARTTP